MSDAGKHTIRTTIDGLREGITCCDSCRRANEIRAATLIETLAAPLTFHESRMMHALTPRLCTARELQQGLVSIMNDRLLRIKTRVVDAQKCAL